MLEKRLPLEQEFEVNQANDLEKAWDAAHAEKPLRDMARDKKLFISKEEKKALGATANKIGEKSLNDKSSSPEKKTKTPDRALFAAIDAGNLLKVGSLINKDNFDVPDENGTTPLIAAAKAGHNRIVGRILAFKPNIDMEDKNRETALSYAIKNKHNRTASMLNAFRKK